MQPSVRSQLLLWLLVPIALLLAVNVWVAYSNAEAMATVVNDRMLLGSARMIGERVTYDEGMLQAVIPPAALQLFQSRAADEVFYRVTTSRGDLLAGRADLPLPATMPPPDGWTYFDADYRGTAVRIVGFVQPIFDSPRDHAALVEVAQTLGSRKALMRDILVRAIGQQLLLVALAAAFLWLGLHRALGPLMRLRDEVLARRPGALESLDTSRVPGELKPLAHALNDYVRRQGEQVAAHDRFIGNAAHQLRTPLTLLNAQVAYALRTPDPEGKDVALRSIHETVLHGTRVVNQLLTLATAESHLGQAATRGQADLREVVRTVLEQQAAAASAKGIDLGFECGDEAVKVPALPAMLHELVANLVDNAVRYTPDGGVVTAVVRAFDDRAELRIEDNGPGIPEREREHVFERFYRLRHDASDGCGLGLAIVREIANASGARVVLGQPPGGQGLAVAVIFPARGEPADALAPDARPQRAETANSVV